MPDYIYLLESRLSPEQRAVLERVQELAQSQELNVYLTGGAVRDLISGQPIRDLDFTVEGNPVKIVREMEKGGAKVLSESEKLRHYEVLFAGEAEGSLSAAREDVYERPGTKPEVRFSGIMDDLRRRDFSINAIAISLNPQSRGLLLDPTNGLADLERQEVRSLTNHSFTNQPIRLMRILRYCARMGFKMESRTQEWFDLAFERGLEKNLEPADVGYEIRSAAREENPVATLKSWEVKGLLEAIHPQLSKRKPDYEGLNKLAKVRMNLMNSGIRPRLQASNTYYIFGRLKPREATSAMKALDFRATEIDAIARLTPDAQKIVQALKNKKMNSPLEAYNYLSTVPPELLAFIETELPNAAALSKIRSYVQKWRPLKMALPAAELDALGIARGSKFDKILDQLFEAQLRGRGKTPEDRSKLLRQYAGIKDDPKKKAEKEKKPKGKETAGNIPLAGAKARFSVDQAKSGVKSASGTADPTKAAATNANAHPARPNPAALAAAAAVRPLDKAAKSGSVVAAKQANRTSPSSKTARPSTPKRTRR